MTETEIKNTISQFVYTGICISFLDTIVGFVSAWQAYHDLIINGIVCLVFFSVYVFIFLKIKNCRNWARRLYILSFIFISLPFMPVAMFATNGGVIYPSVTGLAVCQRLLNFLVYVFDIVFILYLFQPTVRSQFGLKPSNLYVNILLVGATVFSLGLGIGIYALSRVTHQYVHLKNQTVEFTSKGKSLINQTTKKERARATDILSRRLPDWGIVRQAIYAKGFDVIYLFNVNPPCFFIIFFTEETKSVPEMLQALDEMLFGTNLSKQKKTWHALTPTEREGKPIIFNANGTNTTNVTVSADNSPSNGVLIEFEEGKRNVKVLAYGQKINETIVKDFMEHYFPEHA